MMTKDDKILLERYIDHALDDSELKHFLERLKRDPELLEELNEMLCLKGLLNNKIKKHHQKVASSVIRELDKENNDFSFSVIEKVEQHRRKQQSKNRLYGIVISIAALLIVAAGIWVFVHYQAPALAFEIAEAKTVSGHVEISRKGQTLVLKAGDLLYSGDHLTSQDSSSAMIEYLDQTSILVGAKTTLNIELADRRKIIRLDSGQLDADVVKQAPGKSMRVYTQNSTCNVVGTQFSLYADEKQTRLQVTEGKVSLIKDNQQITVARDQYAIAEAETPLKQHALPALLYSTLISDKANRKEAVKANIKGVNRLYILVSDAGDGNIQDHIALLNPKLTNDKNEFDLTELSPNYAASEISQIQINKNLARTAIKASGYHAKGISVHATSLMVWDIPSGYDSFETTAAILERIGGGKTDKASAKIEIFSSLPIKRLSQIKAKISRPNYRSKAFVISHAESTKASTLASFEENTLEVSGWHVEHNSYRIGGNIKADKISGIDIEALASPVKTWGSKNGTDSIVAFAGDNQQLSIHATATDDASQKTPTILSSNSRPIPSQLLFDGKTDESLIFPENGLICIDLGEAKDLSMINLFSKQRASRGLNLALYGSMNKLDFSSFSPERPGNWDALAFIDTRILGSGKHACSIHADKADSIGSYRYLLLYSPDAQHELSELDIYHGGSTFSKPSQNDLKLEFNYANDPKLINFHLSGIDIYVDGKKQDINIRGEADFLEQNYHICCGLKSSKTKEQWSVLSDLDLKTLSSKKVYSANALAVRHARFYFNRELTVKDRKVDFVLHFQSAHEMHALRKLSLSTISLESK